MKDKKIQNQTRKWEKKESLGEKIKKRKENRG